MYSSRPILISFGITPSVFVTSFKTKEKTDDFSSCSGKKKVPRVFDIVARQ